MTLRHEMIAQVPTPWSLAISHALSPHPNLMIAAVIYDDPLPSANDP